VASRLRLVKWIIIMELTKVIISIVMFIISIVKQMSLQMSPEFFIHT